MSDGKAGFVPHHHCRPRWGRRQPRDNQVQREGSGGGKSLRGTCLGIRGGRSMNLAYRALPKHSPGLLCGGRRRGAQRIWEMLTSLTWQHAAETGLGRTEMGVGVEPLNRGPREVWLRREFLSVRCGELTGGVIQVMSQSWGPMLTDTGLGNKRSG